MTLARRGRSISEDDRAVDLARAAPPSLLANVRDRERQLPCHVYQKVYAPEVGLTGQVAPRAPAPKTRPGYEALARPGHARAADVAHDHLATRHQRNPEGGLSQP